MTYSRRRFLRSAVAAGAVLAFRPPRPLLAQGGRDDLPNGYDKPDRFGEVWTGLEYDGEEAYCPIPEELRQRNKGSAVDGAGLCVLASMVTDLNFLGEVNSAAKIWAAGDQDAGGYYPEKFARLVQRVVPDLPFKSVEGKDLQWAIEQTSIGNPCGQTWGEGRWYRDMGEDYIPHMISVIHCTSERWAGIDNNHPKWVIWTPYQEAVRRYVKGPTGLGWGLYLDRKPPRRPRPKPDRPDAPDSPGASWAPDGPSALIGAAAVAGASLLSRKLQR